MPWSLKELIELVVGILVTALLSAVCLCAVMVLALVLVARGL
jgi:hypothetical protein